VIASVFGQGQGPHEVAGGLVDPARNQGDRAPRVQRTGFNLVITVIPRSAEGGFDPALALGMAAEATRAAARTSGTVRGRVDQRWR
jgi:hypothetical protein